MDISPRGIKLIVEFEGKKKLLPDGKYCAYLDTLAKPNIPTIYCGLTRGVKMGMVISEEEGERMFRRELASYEDAIESCVKVPLNQHQFDALVSFTYNCGAGALKKSTLLKLLNKGQYDQVPAQLLKWNKAGGKVWPGLVRRRIAEGALWSTPVREEVTEPVPGVEDIPADYMPQQVEPSQPTVTSVMMGSSTVKAAAIGLVSTVVQGWNWLFGAIKEAGPDIAANQQTMTSMEALLKVIGANVGLIAAGIAAGSLMIVIFRRLNQEKA